MNIYISGDTDPTLTAELAYLIEWLENRLNFPACGGVDLDLTITEDLDADGYTAGDGEIIYMELKSTDLRSTWLTVCHEMVHVKQILEDRALDEDEAYFLEEILLNEYKRTL